MVVAAF